MASESTDVNSSNKTVYIGNLPLEATEQLLWTLFEKFGTVVSCRILKDMFGVDKYGFIEYSDHQAAELSISSMDGRMFMGNTIKVNWSNSTGPTSSNSGGGGHEKPSHHPTVFVGDLTNEVTEAELREAFGKYGTISNCRIVRDPITLKCKNYGFISFVSKEAAENAITYMNGYWIGNRSIRTNWAQKKFPMSGNNPKQDKKLTYEEIENLASPSNKTIFCGNITRGISEGLLKGIFARFGTITETRVFTEKNYGFVTFAEKSSAVRAILEMNQSDVNGDTVKVSWGKELWMEPATRTNFGGFSTNANVVRVPSPAEPYYWQNLQGYQAACANLLQQQFQSNAHVQPNYYPYHGHYYGQPYFQAAAGNGSQPQQQLTLSNQNFPEMQSSSSFAKKARVKS